MKQGIIALLVLVGAAAASYMLVFFKSAPPKEPVEAKAYPVKAVLVDPKDHRVQVYGYGTTAPRQSVSVVPEVRGKIVNVNPELVPGRILEEGDILFKINPREYEAAVEVARGQLATAEFNLEVERGNQIVAKKEFELLKNSGDGAGSSSLALRKPHLKERLAAVEAAKANLAVAELNVERCTLTAPFKSLVVSENVDVGQFVQSSPLVELVGSDSFEVEVKIARSQSKWFFGKNDIEAEVSVGGSASYPAQYLGFYGDLDDTGKQARVLVEVADPLSQNPPLLLNTFVQVSLLGEVVSNTYAVPPTAVREGSQLWVAAEDSTLEYLDFEILYQTDTAAVGRLSGVSGPVQVITGSVDTPLRGMQVKVIP